MIKRKSVIFWHVAQSSWKILQCDIPLLVVEEDSGILLVSLQCLWHGEWERKGWEPSAPVL